MLRATPSLQDTFEKAEKLETRMGDLYRLLARAHEADPELTRLFRTLADEEDQHASRIRLFASSYRHDPKTRRATTVVAHDLDALLADLERAHADFARAVPPAAQTFARLSAMEQRLAVAHVGRLVVGMPPAFVALFAGLEKADRAHAAMLAAHARAGA